MTEESSPQPKVTGYRQLSKEDVALINRIKAVGEDFERMTRLVQHHIRNQYGTNSDAEDSRLANAQPERWAAMALTDAQVAVMKLVRAVAQPVS